MLNFWGGQLLTHFVWCFLLGICWYLFMTGVGIFMVNKGIGILVLLIGTVLMGLILLPSAAKDAIDRATL